MKYPDFFNKIETIILHDELSEFLGTFEDGIIEFSYLDIVKSAGHSCPTVAGAYLMCLYGLKELYGNEIPKRGEIKVEFKEAQTDGVAGVIGAVIANITGATTDYGFKGIGKKFNRTSLMKFSSDINSSVKFTRLDTNKSANITYNPNIIPADNRQKLLMQKILQNQASIEEKQEFAQLWQNRVKEIFNNANQVILKNK